MTAAVAPAASVEASGEVTSDAVSGEAMNEAASGQGRTFRDPQTDHYL